MLSICLKGDLLCDIADLLVFAWTRGNMLMWTSRGFPLWLV
ncbi:hypothetical protein HanXRQr2_Chr11g0470151 [Helianthus annuus]|uniref:Uncharacterized protein n=1 Tax=Helianthus annuus TaxID=4232 RepID=A0A9K3HL94_HELAN|nr:hypothetical protein HanXRQr2_Chr11g0470151 [Helianthus annuus]KAJ0873518.1 hypothetical protein HanPSC8_Chr11g0453411 [Helianthus annuus]